MPDNNTLITMASVWRLALVTPKQFCEGRSDGYALGLGGELGCDAPRLRPRSLPAR